MQFSDVVYKRLQTHISYNHLTDFSLLQHGKVGAYMGDTENMFFAIGSVVGKWCYDMVWYVFWIFHHHYFRLFLNATLSSINLNRPTSLSNDGT